MKKEIIQQNTTNYNHKIYLGVHKLKFDKEKYIINTGQEYIIYL